MGDFHLDPDFETMKVVLLLFISSSVAFAQECPTLTPPKCDEFSMPCYGGADMNGCPYGDFCAPSKGAPGFDGVECSAHCPTKCDADYMLCPAGHDGNGCEMPGSCMPLKGGPVGNDGTNVQYSVHHLVMEMRCLAMEEKTGTAV